MGILHNGLVVIFQRLSVSNGCHFPMIVIFQGLSFYMIVIFQISNGIYEVLEVKSKLLVSSSFTRW